MRPNCRTFLEYRPTHTSCWSPYVTYAWLLVFDGRNPVYFLCLSSLVPYSVGGLAPIWCSLDLWILISTPNVSPNSAQCKWKTNRYAINKLERKKFCLELESLCSWQNTVTLIYIALIPSAFWFKMSWIASDPAYAIFSICKNVLHHPFLFLFFSFWRAFENWYWLVWRFQSPAFWDMILDLKGAR